MRSFGFLLLVFGLFGSQGLSAGMIQTTKGVRLSILHHDPAEGRPKEADPVLAEKAGGTKAKPTLLTEKNAPKGKVTVRSVASGRTKKPDRSRTGGNPVAAHR